MSYMEHSLHDSCSSVLERIQAGIQSSSTYFGVPCYKSPLDTWVYQELVFAIKPSVVVEIGTACGGSALYFSHLLDLTGGRRVITLDINHAKVPDVVRNKSNISMILGDGCSNIKQVESLLLPTDRILVIEDSSHTYQNTLNVLNTYQHLVSKESYFIVEDSICHHGLNDGFSPGPYEAIESFVQSNKNFVIDRTKEKFFLTWNPKGYLKRI